MPKIFDRSKFLCLCVTYMIYLFRKSCMHILKSSFICTVHVFVNHGMERICEIFNIIISRNCSKLRQSNKDISIEKGFFHSKKKFLILTRKAKRILILSKLGELIKKFKNEFLQKPKFPIFHSKKKIHILTHNIQFLRTKNPIFYLKKNYSNQKTRHSIHGKNFIYLPKKSDFSM